jgi:hypothetical protein
VRDDEEDPGPPLRLGALRLPPAFERRTVTVAPGDLLPPHITCWRDAIVSVEQGLLEMVGPGGEVLRLGAGSMLLLQGVEQIEVRNVGAEPLVLAAIRRRESDPAAPADAP